MSDETEPHDVSALDRLPPRTRRGDATAAIRRFVLGGQMPSGTPLKESDLARALGVSRPTVREAIRPLVEQGILIYEPYKGIKVAEYGDQALRDLNEVRVALETLASLRVATMISAAEQPLRDRLGEMDRARRADDPGALLNAHFAFHRALFELAGNPVLFQMWDGIEIQTRLALQLDQDAHTGLMRVPSTHEAILTALLTKHEKTIVRAIEVHILNTASGLRPPDQDTDVAVNRAAIVAVAPG